MNATSTLARGTRLLTLLALALCAGAPLLAMLVAPALPAWAEGSDTKGLSLADDSRQIAEALVRDLSAALQKQLADSGAAGAITVCKDLAPKLLRERSLSSGFRVTRVSLKVRNPLTGTPDAWEQAVLLDLDKRAASGEDVASLEHIEIVDEPTGKYYRYMKALPVTAACLPCHGAQTSLTPEVGKLLSASYPHDRARDYGLGQLRGAVSIKRPLP